MIAPIDDSVRITPIYRKAREPGVARSSLTTTKYWLISSILLVALLAFETFNFDTTRYALANLLGDVRFLGISWATILAVAFCGIDFAGLLRIFSADSAQEVEGRSEVWYLMAAWLLGATMNAVMTWYAVSLTLLTHDIGNELIGRQQLLIAVPLFVAILVWLTRILFIGSLSVAGGRLMAEVAKKQNSSSPSVPESSAKMAQRATLRPKREP